MRTEEGGRDTRRGLHHARLENPLPHAKTQCQCRCIIATVAGGPRRQHRHRGGARLGPATACAPALAAALPGHRGRRRGPWVGGAGTAARRHQVGPASVAQKPQTAVDTGTVVTRSNAEGERVLRAMQVKPEQAVDRMLMLCFAPLFSTVPCAWGLPPSHVYRTRPKLLRTHVPRLTHTAVLWIWTAGVAARWRW